jgi:WD40 repeat protein
MSEPEQEPILARERRLHEILGGFFDAVEAGEAPNPQDLIAAHPDLADDLAAYYADEARFQHLVAPLHATVGSGAAPADQTATAAFGAEPAPSGANTDATGQLSGDGNGLDPALPTGSRIRYFGDYELKHILGRGGMGVVYQAKQLSLSRLVALKMIRAGLWAGDDEVRRFQNEAEAVANLDHPRIVTIYEVGQYEGHHYFSMRLVEGSGLEKVLDRHAEDPRRAARLVSEVARAVHHAHQRGILHRDLKPSNILLDGDGHPHVTDFGLAKRLDGDRALSISGSVVGTPQYMSPEQASGSRQAITTATDVYGLGAILYAALTGRPPFQADSLAETLRAVREKPVEAPSKINPRVDRDLETIVLKCLEKDPKRRYDSAAAVADDLERYLRGEPILARRTGAWERVLKWSRRHPAAAALVGMSGVAALTLVGLGVALAYHSRLQAAYAEKDAALARELNFLYQNRVIFAERALYDNTPDRAEELLDECPPSLRNWEWNYLKRQCHADVMTIACHQGGDVRSLAISKDGRLLATCGSQHGSVKLWRLDRGEIVRTLSGHDTEEGVSCAFSPDGKRIASVSGSVNRPNWLVLHQVDTGEVVWRVPVNTCRWATLAFSPDGREIAVASGVTSARANATKNAGWLKTFDAGTGAERSSFTTDGEDAFHPSFPRDGKSLVAVIGPWTNDDTSGRPNKIRVWDASTGKVRRNIPAPDRRLFIIACYSPDGRAIATGSFDTTLRLWDAQNGAELRAFRGHQNSTNFVAFSRDGQRIASASDDGSARVWDTQTGECLITLRGHEGAFNTVVFSPDGRRLVSGSPDGTARVWDATAGPEALTISASATSVRALAFSPDGCRLVTGDFDGVLKLWEFPSGRLLETWPGHSQPVCDVTFNPDGTRLASAAGNWMDKADRLGEVQIRDATTGLLLKNWQAHRKVAWHVRFSPDGRWLASSGGEISELGQEIIFWDPANGTKQRTITIPEGGVLGLALSRDGRRIAGGMRNFIRTWDAETGVSYPPIEQPSLDTLSLAYSPDGRTLFTTTGTGSLGVWDVVNGQWLKSLRSDNFQTSGVAVNRAGTRIATVGSDHTVKLWDTTTYRLLITLRGHTVEDRGIYGVAFSPDGHWIASSDDSGVVKLWDGSPWKGGAP